jgi:cation:H+ antiporter
MESPFILLLAGFIILGLAGEALLRGAVTLANALRVSPLVIGLTIIAFGTSVPELTVSINAVLDGQPDISIGNVVGSNIANILLVFGRDGSGQPVFCQSRHAGARWRLHVCRIRAVLNARLLRND